MIPMNEFGKKLHQMGFTFYTGVPCSFLKSMINYAINECEYVGAANEGDAIAIAAGAWLGGKKSVVLMQNSGLTNAVSPLVSLNYPFRIPVLGFVSLRGEPGILDEPQHELMGQITTHMLGLMQVEWQYLSSDPVEATNQLLKAVTVIEQTKPFFFVVRKETFATEPLRIHETKSTLSGRKRVKKKADQMPSRYEALTVINNTKDANTVHLATTGKTGRELYEIEDSAGNLYMVGSMGCASSMGLGIALARPEKSVLIIDGDGSVLMRMGSLATNGYYGPTNMMHILLDNNSHDSTGGQSTVSHNVDFIEIAAACGYRHCLYVHSLEELEQAIQEWKQTKNLTFLYMKITTGSNDQLGRPHIKPHEVKDRLRRFLHIELPAKKDGGSVCER